MVRVLYDKLRNLNISTLEVHRCLEVAGIEMSKRSVQSHLDTELNNCMDDKVRVVVNALIKSREDLIKLLKTVK